jgi:hypothetical protein
MPPRYLLTMIVRMVGHPQSLTVTLLGHPKKCRHNLTMMPYSALPRVRQPLSAVGPQKEGLAVCNMVRGRVSLAQGKPKPSLEII